jgi:3-deoxy-D-manno-octulosonic-acid transferase
MNQYDVAYAMGLGISAPVWLLKGGARRKVFRAFSERMGHATARDRSRPAVMVHAVSLGEINATRSLIDQLRKLKPGLDFIVSVTTDTGFARGKELYGSVPDVTLVRYPLDFSSAIDRLLNALRPSVVVLLELEVWPNFIQRCARRGVPVLLINGRITPGSYSKYKLARPVVGGMFRQLSHVAVQDENYAQKFAEVGVRPDRLSVTGTMKFDTAEVTDHVDGQQALAAAVGLGKSHEQVWVCGSTGPGEEEIILPIYRILLERFPALRLVIVPRKPERFDEVAALIASSGFGVLRRSGKETMPGEPTVILGDTIGELRKFYALADVVFVGRSLVDLGHRQHGSDMIEPAALAKPFVVGPYTANFADAMNHFKTASATAVVNTAAELSAKIAELLADKQKATEMGQKAQQVVRQQQGATARHAKLILDTLEKVLSPQPGKAPAASNGTSE